MKKLTAAQKKALKKIGKQPIPWKRDEFGEENNPGKAVNELVDMGLVNKAWIFHCGVADAGVYELTEAGRAELAELRNGGGVRWLGILLKWTL